LFQLQKSVTENYINILAWY